MSKRSCATLICAVSLSLASVAPAAADAVVQTTGNANPPAAGAPTAQPAPSAGSMQSAPNTTVVQPAAQPAPATTVVQPPANNAQAPVVVERDQPRSGAVVQQTNVDSGEKEAPSVFARAAQGLVAGAVVGTASGYLVGRRDGWERDDWRAVGLGVGVGALAGTGFGLMLGFMDQGGVRAGRYIPRDMMAGTGLGGLVGVIAGGIAAAAKNDGERVAYGASIGVLAGAGLGLITGIVEGATKNRQETRSTTVTSKLRLAPTVAMAQTSTHSSVVMPALAGRF